MTIHLWQEYNNNIITKGVGNEHIEEKGRIKNDTDRSRESLRSKSDDLSVMGKRSDDTETGKYGKTDESFTICKGVKNERS